jgi:hypothetical protein
MTACKKDENNDTPTVAQRTVMVYMSGDNNLSGIVSEDIREMQQGITGIPQNNNLVVFIDRAISNEKPFIARVTKEAKLDTLYKYPYDFYASDPELFGEVLQQITTLCPAKEYGLVLWGHATGWVVESDTIAQRRAYGVDNGQWMNITQMARALEGLKDQSVLPKLSFIFADCCNMMCVENGYELRNVTDYLIGAPSEIPGYGAPYQLVVPYLFKNGSDLYKGIIDTYYDYYLQNFSITYPSLYGYSIPLSVVDMTQMEQLAEATRMVIRPISQVKQDSMVYYYREELPALYDAGDYVTRNIADSTQRAAWWKALNKAVPYRRVSARWMTVYPMLEYDYRNEFVISDERTACVSMFLPFSKYNFTSKYMYIDGFLQMQWYYAAGCEQFFEF